MEIGKYHLSLFNQFVLRCNRLLHLDNHVGYGIDIFNGRQDSRTYGDVIIVREPAVCAGRSLHIHRMTFLHQLGYSGRGHSYTVLVVLDFFGYSDNHNVIC